MVNGLFRWIVQVRDRAIDVAEVDSIVERCVMLKDRDEVVWNVAKEREVTMHLVQGLC